VTGITPEIIKGLAWEELVISPFGLALLCDETTVAVWEKVFEKFAV